MPPSSRFKVRVEATVSPSEDEESVLQAVKGILGEVPASARKDHSQLKVETDSPGSLDRLHDQLRDRRVRGAARKRFLAGRNGNESTIMVNRQAATAGVIALCDREEESPLGPVYLTIRTDDFDGLLKWLTDYP